MLSAVSKSFCGGCGLVNPQPPQKLLLTALQTCKKSYTLGLAKLPNIYGFIQRLLITSQLCHDGGKPCTIRRPGQHCDNIVIVDLTESSNNLFCIDIIDLDD